MQAKAIWMSALAAAFLGSAPARALELGAVKRELWSAQVGVEQAQVALRGLSAIAGDSQAYDAAVAGELRDRAGQDLRKAEQQVGRLWRVPGQDDETLRHVASVQDSVRKLRERVQRLGRATRAKVDARPDLRKGAAGGSQARAQDDDWMPAAGSEALQDTRVELRALWGQVESIEGELRKLAEGYRIADELPHP